MNVLARVNLGSGGKTCIELLRPSTALLNESRCISDEISFPKKVNESSLKVGRGGRSSFSGIVATVFGATGFMGLSVCNQLGKTGSQLIIPYRSDFYSIRDYKLLGDLGQVLFTPFHLLDENSIRKAVKHSNVVINLVGRDFETNNFNFHQVNVDGPRRIARICKEEGIDKLIHVSSLNTTVDHKGYYEPGGSVFLQTKGEGEQAVIEEFPDAVILRPSDCYGIGDRFVSYYYVTHTINRTVAKSIYVPYAGEGIFKQPVYVGDVAEGIKNAAYDHTLRGKIFEAVGPRRYELCDLVDWWTRVTRRDMAGTRTKDLNHGLLTYWRAKWWYRYHPYENFKHYNVDRIERFAVTDQVTGLPTLEDLGVNLSKMEDRINWLLKKQKIRQYYGESVGEFEKPAPPAYQEMA